MNLRWEPASNLLNISGELNRTSILAHYPIKKSNFSGQSLTVNMNDTVSVDTAGVAWLLHLIETANAANCNISFQHLPQQLVDIATVTDVLPLLDNTAV